MRPSDLPDARAALPAWLATGAPVALFLDYDGTLTPIVARPEDALLRPEMRTAVAALTERCASVVIVSGRDRRTAQDLVGIPGIGYVGSHGFDIMGPGRTDESRARLEVGDAHLTDLDAAEGELREALSGISGAQVERKRFSVAAHHRRVAEAQRGRVIDAVAEALARHPGLRRAEGSAVIELRPDLDWDKGRAVLWLLEQLGLESALALHLGDDLTDETVFAALALRRSGPGAGIVVGDPDRDTAATHRLADPTQVKLFLRELAAGLARRQVRVAPDESRSSDPPILDGPAAERGAPARYFPVKDTPLRMEAGLKPFGTDFGNGSADRQFFQADREWRRYVERKGAAPAERLRVIDRDDLTPVHARAHAWLVDTLQREHPDLAAGLDRELAVGTPIGEAYAQITRRVQEDLTVLHRGPDGRGAAIAVHVCFPSGWRPERIGGLGFGAIHEPVPDFADSERAERSMVTSMVDRGPFVRFVWTIAADDHLDRHPEQGARAPWQPGARGWLRVERQVTIGLPEVDASIFLIRVYLYPFESLSVDERRTLARALEVMPAEVLRYKGLTGAPRAIALSLLGTPD